MNKNSKITKEYSVLDISAYIINYCNKKNILCSVYKLEQILYFSQCLFIFSKHKNCFSDSEMFPSIALTKDQDPSAVRIKIIYDKYKEFGEKSIPFVKEYTTIDKTNQVWQINTKTFSIKDIEISDQRAIKEVIDKFKDWPIQELNNIIKNQTPYAVAVKKYYHCKKPIPISNDSIKNFFP